MIGHSDLTIRRCLIATAVEAEREAVLRGLAGDRRFEVIAAGAGPASAAANTAKALAAGGFGLAISAGIGGGFPGRAEIGSLVVATEVIAADLGAEAPEGFIMLEKLGFGCSRSAAHAEMSSRWTAKLQQAGLAAAAGPIVTVSTVTGSAETAALLQERVPGAAAEAMEGFGVAEAARACQLPMLEIRAISNAVGPRDRASWRIPEALSALEKAFAIFTEVYE